MKRIACFFTGGYTELNAMKRFMSKINDQVQYIQLCPTGIRKSKEDIRRRRTIETIDQRHNGLTGESLINYILEVIQSERFREEEYDAILIEDDKDDRFLEVQEDGTSVINMNAWEDHKYEVKRRIYEFYSDIPIIFVYAAPEIETWFLADWENSFGKVYKEPLVINQKTLSTEQNNYFSVQFHRYVKENILTPRYENRLEEYGYFCGSYNKLSEKLQNAFVNAELLAEPIFESVDSVFYYSKKLHGEDMLDSIDPNMVIKSCRTFFMSGVLELLKIQ